MAEQETSAPTKITPRRQMLVEHDGAYHWKGTEFEKAKNLRCRDSDIWVCSYPRSGTTLTQQTTYLIKTLDFVKGSTVLLDDRFPQFEFKAERSKTYRGVDYVDQLPEDEPRFIKCHLHYRHLPTELQAGKGKIIYIVRNPKSAVPSLFRLLSFMNMPPAASLREYLERFLTGKDVYACPWGPHVREYWEHKNDQNVLFLQFEQTIKDRAGTVKRIADFLDVTLTEEDINKVVHETTIEGMKANKYVNFAHFEDKYTTDKSFGGFINKGEVTGWRKFIPEDLIPKFDEMIEREIGHTDIRFAD